MPPANPPSLAAATVRQLRELGGEELLRRLVTLLLELTPQRLGALAGGLESGDLPAARHAAHALCSTAGTLGAASLLDAAQVIQAQTLANAPRDHVIGAGRIAADAQPADHFLARGEQWQAAAEHVDAADLVTDHRIVGFAEIARRSLIGDAGVDRIAVLQAVQRTTRLHGRIQVGR